MSAQVLLSMIAPGLPATPQGSAGGDALAFEGLLAAMMDGEPAPDASDLDVPPAEPANDDAPAAASAILTPAPPPPSPVVLVTGLDAAPPPVADAPAPALPEAEAGPAVPDLTAQLSRDAEVQPAQAAGETKASVPVRADQAAPAAEAATQNPAPQDAATQDASVRGAPIPAASPPSAIVDGGSAAASPAPDGAAPALPAPPKADAPAADDASTAPPPSGIPAKTGPDPALVLPQLPAPTPAPAAFPAPPPPPALRALAERTSKPLEAAPTAEGASVVDPRAPAAVAAGSITPSGGPADAASPRVETAPAIIVDAGADGSDEPAPELPPAETASSAPAALAAREAAAPTLSRVAIDATAQIAAQILKKLDGRATRFEMALTPDELGRVDVKLDIDAEGRLSARLAFDNPAAAADLRGRADDLRRELQQAGFHVADDAFEFAERDSGSSAFDRGQDARDGQARAFARASRLNIDADAALLAPRWTPLTLSPSGVDLKV